MELRLLDAVVCMVVGDICWEKCWFVNYNWWWISFRLGFALRQIVLWQSKSCFDNSAVSNDVMILVFLVPKFTFHLATLQIRSLASRQGQTDEWDQRFNVWRRLHTTATRVYVHPLTEWTAFGGVWWDALLPVTKRQVQRKNNNTTTSLQVPWTSTQETTSPTLSSFPSCLNQSRPWFPPRRSPRRRK